MDEFRKPIHMKAYKRAKLPLLKLSYFGLPRCPSLCMAHKNHRTSILIHRQFLLVEWVSVYLPISLGLKNRTDDNYSFRSTFISNFEFSKSRKLNLSSNLNSKLNSKRFLSSNLTQIELKKFFEFEHNQKWIQKLALSCTSLRRKSFKSFLD